MSLALTFKYLFGRIPSTEKLESQQNELFREYNDFCRVESSEDVKEFYRLKDLTESVDFINKKKEIQSLRYKNSEEYAQECQLEKISKNRKISLFNTTIRSDDFKRFLEIRASQKLNSFKDLDARFSQMRHKDLKKADEETHKQLDEYETLKKDEDIFFYLNFVDSGIYENYLEIKDSDLLKKYNTLTELVKSVPFQEKKEWLLDVDRYSKTDFYKDEQRYEQLKKANDILLYQKYEKDERMSGLKKWELSFMDDFNDSSLDLSKWTAGNAIPEHFFKEAYSQEDDLQAYTSGKNISLSNSVLKLEVKDEGAVGKKLTRELGFVNDSFAYTSDYIHTASSFNQKYGVVEAKIKVKKARGVIAGLFLSSGQSLPHVDVMHLAGKSFGALAMDNENKEGSGSFLFPSWGNDQFMIYCLIWTPDKLVWKINGIKVKEQPFRYSGQELFLVLTVMVKDELDSSQLPYGLEVDWIRCYKRREL